MQVSPLLRASPRLHLLQPGPGGAQGPGFALHPRALTRPPLLRPRLHLLSKVPLTIVDHCRRPHNTQKFSAILLATLEKDQEDSLPSWLTSGGQRNL